MKKYTIKYINVKHDDIRYPVSCDGFGGSYYFTSNPDMAYKRSCQKRDAMYLGRQFATRIFHDLYCFGSNGDFLPGMPERLGDTWDIIEIEEEPDDLEAKCLHMYCLNKSYLERIKRYTQKYLDRLLETRKPGKTYMY